MNPEVKTKWVAALRSGEYKQGPNALRHDGKFCCLGVLCDLYIKEHPGDSAWEPDQGNGAVHQGCTMFPSDAVQQWAGLLDGDEYVCMKDEDTEMRLSRLNDEGYPFRYIADAIEASL